MPDALPTSSVSGSSGSIAGVNYWRRYGAPLIAHGWRCIPIKPGDKAPGRWTGTHWVNRKGWSNAGVPTAGVLAEYQSYPPPCAGIGIVAGKQGDAVGSIVHPLDVDVRHALIASTIQVLAWKRIGVMPVRVGQPPKWLSLLRCTEPITKMATASYRFPGEAADAKPHHVEILTTQFVAFGRHPCGTDYAWSGGSPATLAPSELPIVTPAAMRAFLAACEDTLSNAGGVVVSKAAEHREGASGHGRHRSPNLPRHAGVLALLGATGYVLHPGNKVTAGRKIPIRCPFDHPERGDSGTDLLPGGGIKCHHKTCHGRQTEDYIAKLKEIAAANGQDGELIFIEAFGRKQLELVQAAFAHADDGVLMRLRQALVAGDAAALDQVTDAIAHIPRPGVLAVLSEADVLGLAIGRVRDRLLAADTEDAARAAVCALTPATVSHYRRQVQRAAWAARRARAAQAACDRRAQAARETLAALGLPT